MNRLTIILILSSTCLCFPEENYLPKFRLNIGAGGGYVHSLEYMDYFDDSKSLTQSSHGALCPSVNIGLSFGPRFSLYWGYSHYIIFPPLLGEGATQVSYISVSGVVVPSEKFNRLFLSFSLGFLHYGPNSFPDHDGYSFNGPGTTISLGYKVNKHFHVRLDLDYLFIGSRATIERTAINANDFTNTIVVVGTATCYDIYGFVLMGLSASWDIF